MFTKRTLFAALIAACLLTSCTDNKTQTEQSAPATAEHKQPAHVTVNTPDEGIAELKAGNARYVEGKLINTDYKQQREATKEEQHPFGMILTCMDSRVPPEIIFDQGIGNIFNGRVAGNVEDVNMLGSLEYATAVVGTKLIVVLGHDHCGAIKGAIDNVKLGNLTHLLEQIRPAIKGDTSNRQQLIEQTTINNVKMTISEILERSPVVADLVKQGKVKIVGATYNIATGKVDFME